MKKLLMTVLMLVGVATFAVEETKKYDINPVFQQFTQGDYHDSIRNFLQPGQVWNAESQNWSEARYFTLSVKGGTGVWLSNYISNFYGTETPNIDGGNVPLDKNTYNMSPNAYGYIYAKDMPSLKEEKPNYDGLIHWSNGATIDITYTSVEDNNLSGKTPGYFLDYFEEGAEIYLVMTTIPADGVESVDSYQYVQEGGHTSTILQNRQHDDLDNAGNIRINFGIDNGEYGDGVGIAREFVAVYSDDKDLINSQLGGGSAGGPLPGVFFAGLLSLGTVFGASKAKRQKRA